MLTFAKMEGFALWLTSNVQMLGFGPQQESRLLKQEDAAIRIVALQIVHSRKHVS